MRRDFFFDEIIFLREGKFERKMKSSLFDERKKRNERKINNSQHKNFYERFKKR